MSADLTTDLGLKLADLWNDERCVWHMDFDAFMNKDDPWLLVLEWTQEYGNDHQADWVTFTWQFYGATAEQSLRDAVAWCEGLVPFERCHGCDGDGSYGPPASRTTCEDCGGSGLAPQ